jgi:hypothetical protein
MTRRAALALVAVALAAAGCGSSEGKRSVALVWKSPPKLYVPPDLPRDRIVRGVIENQSLKKATLKTGDFKLLDADGAGSTESPPSSRATRTRSIRRSESRTAPTPSTSSCGSGCSRS